MRLRSQGRERLLYSQRKARRHLNLLLFALIFIIIVVVRPNVDGARIFTVMEDREKFYDDIM
jgi:t-SNARE complex subunit (syntaxin)